MILERLQVLLEGDTSGLAGAFRNLAAGITAGAVLKKIIDESTEAQYAMAQLEAAVESTGGAAGKSVGELDALASALQKETTYSDDAVKSAEALLLTFTKIAGPTFDRATRAVLDMATATGTDLKSASIQLGKALNDPIIGITALQRVGVSFSASQKDLIKDLAETGRLAEAQALILKELETEFGGSAAAARDTLGGALKALGNQWGDLFEISRSSSGGIIGAINDMGEALPAVRDRFEKFFTRLQEWGINAAVNFERLRVTFRTMVRDWAIAQGASAQTIEMLNGKIESATVGLTRMEEAAAETWAELFRPGTGRTSPLAVAAEQAERTAMAFEAAVIPARGVAVAFQDMVTAGVKFPEVLTPLEKASENMAALGESAVDVATAGAEAFIGFATGSADAFGRFVDFALAELERLIARLIVVKALKAIFAGSTGGIGGAVLGALEGRASGGPVSGGRPYIVGERGPELFVPSSSGSIMPNGGAASFALPPLPKPMSPSEAASQAWLIQTVEKILANLGSR